MRLVAIEHERCDEYDKTEYFVIPEGMPLEEVDDAVAMAQSKYIDALTKFKTSGNLPQCPPTNIGQVNDDSKTIGELKADLRAYGIKQTNHVRLEQEVAGTFEKHLGLLGFVKLSDYVGTDFVKTGVNWGHRHGQNLNY